MVLGTPTATPPPAVTFESDRTVGGKSQRRFEDFAIARALGHAVLHGDLDLVPLLWLVLLQLQVGSGDEVIAALELRLADEDPAVGIHRRAEFELEHEVFRKLRDRVKLSGELVGLIGEGHGNDPVLDDVASGIGGFGFTVLPGE